MTVAERMVASPSFDVKSAKTHPVYRNGDGQLVSSDGVTFFVEQARLSSASTGLRTLLDSPRTKLPHRAEALAPFLDLLTRRIEPFRVRGNVLRDIDALSLLAKYDCKSALQYAVATLTCLVMEGEVCPMQAFIVGAHLGDLGLCRTAIVHGDVPALEEHAQRLVQPYWLSVPDEYRWALVQCWNSSGDPKARGNEFIKLMYLAQGYSPIES